MVHLIINVWMAEKIFQFTIARTHIPSALYRISKYLLLKNLKLSTPPRPCLFTVFTAFYGFCVCYMVGFLIISYNTE